MTGYFDRAVLLAGLVMVPTVFVIDGIASVLSGEHPWVWTWTLYPIFLGLAWWQWRADTPDASYLMIPVTGVLVGLNIAENVTGADVGGTDATTVMVVLVVIGLIMSIKAGDRWFPMAVGFGVIALGWGMWSAAVDGESARDAIIRGSISGIALLLGASLAARLVQSYVQASDRLAEQVQARGDLIAAVSHELRTPLTAVLGFTEFLLAAGDPADEHQRDLRMIAEQARDMADIVEDLLTSARAENGTLVVQPAPTEIGRIVSMITASERIQALASEKSLTVHSEDAIALADAVRVRQILRNLITNAMRYGGNNVNVRVDPARDRVLIRVTDDGATLSSDDAERVFEPYYRASHRPAHPGSVGLGLALSRELARLMDGDLTVDLTSDQTVFTLELPMVPTPVRH